VKFKHKNHKVRVGIVGSGDTAMYHAKVWSNIDAVEIIGIYSSNKSRSITISEKYNCKVFSDVDDLMSECSLIDIVTINSLHGYYALKAINHNCHVVIEKPIDINLEIARKVCKEANNNVVVSVINNYRFNCSFRRMKKLLDIGKIGNVSSGKITVVWPRSDEYYFSHNGWRMDSRKVGGGVLMHQCIHHIDLLHWLFGEIQSLNGIASDFVSDKIERTFSGEVLFKNGVKVELCFTTMVGGESFEEVELQGDKGKIVASSRICHTSKLDKIYQLFKKKFNTKNDRCNNNLEAQFVEIISLIKCRNYTNISADNGFRALETVLRFYGN
jgi:predicted dehydrogenase